MALRIDWTKQAEQTYENIVLYLEQHWSEREVKNFVIRVNEVLQRIAKSPRLYRKSKHSSKKNRAY